MTEQSWIELASRRSKGMNDDGITKEDLREAMRDMQKDLHDGR